MPRNVLFASGYFEIGETFFDAHGQPHIVTDVLVCHYIKSGTYRVFYEVDNSGIFEDLTMQEMTSNIAEKPKTKPELRITKFPQKAEND